MKDFDKEFKEIRKKTEKQDKIAIIISSIFISVCLGFGVWVVVKVMQHFGII